MDYAFQWVINASAVITAFGILSVPCVWFGRRAMKLLTFIDTEMRSNGGSTFRDRVEYGIARQVAHNDIDREPVFEADRDGNFTFANRALQRLAQCGSGSFLGTEWYHIVAGYDQKRVWEAWCDAVRNGRSFEERFAITASDGSLYVVDCEASPIRTGDTVTGWLGKYRHVEAQQDSRRRRRA